MNDIEEIVQLAFSAGARHEECRRGVCVRNRLCIPPRDPLQPAIFRCPHDSEEDWQMRFAAVQKLGEWMKRVLERQLATVGKPSPFATPPEPDLLDIDKLPDLAALFRREGPPAG